MAKLMKRFKLPKYCDVKTIVVRELDAKDELEASIWADKNMPKVLKESPMANIEAEQREAIRISLVEVDGRKVNSDGAPFLEMDNWSMRTMRFVQAAFNELNGIDPEDLKNFKTGAEVVTETAPGELPKE